MSIPNQAEQASFSTLVAEEKLFSRYRIRAWTSACAKATADKRAQARARELPTGQ
jgi:hypothetical protein